MPGVKFFQALWRRLEQQVEIRGVHVQIADDLVVCQMGKGSGQ
jgi:hypothetical protein